MLSQQLLTSDNKSTLSVVKHLGYVQLDTISVVERAHHHVIWARNSSYNPSELNQLMKKRKVYEYWAHAAAILPMSEYRFSLVRKKLFQSRESSWFPRDKKVMDFVLKRIKTEGPLQSRDFKNKSKGKNSGWWDWKPAKKALERLFLEGSLEVSHRDAFRKVYDLPENIIPSSVNTSIPSDEEYYEYLINLTIRHHGFATTSEIAYLKKFDLKKNVQKTINNLVEDGKLVQLNINGLDDTYYSYPKLLNQKLKARSRVLILSPFDNLVIQRKKLENIYNFKYQIECYVPEPKRVYGYFTLPIFKGPKPIGRIDCKADRKNKILIVKAIHSETSSKINSLIKTKLNSFAKFNNCGSIAWQ